MTSTVAVLSANEFTNGSFDGPYGYSMVPSGWEDFHGTTDTASPVGNPLESFAGIGSFPYAASPDGGTFASSIDFSGPEGQREGLRQSVTGLVVGQSYEIRFEFTNLALYDDSGRIATNAHLEGQNYSSAGRWLIAVDGNVIGSTPVVMPVAIPGTQIWSVYSQPFLSASDSATFDFISDWVSGPALDPNVGSALVDMGIDGVSLTPVPEPSAALLVLGGLIGLLCTARTINT